MAFKQYSNLVFFNKHGKPLGLTYDENTMIWTGSVHLPEVSVRLFENETIYILERFLDANNAYAPTFGIPHIYDPNTGSSCWSRFDAGSSADFRLFKIDNPYEASPVIEFPTGNLPLDFDDDVSTDVENGDDLISANIVRKALRVDVSLCSETDGIRRGTLIIEDEQRVIAQIGFYGEILGEDERLNILLGNMGEGISEREEFIFAESDISEDLPNYKIINQKRKELLLELHNIKPYLAGYRGVVNIIKYFGFYNVHLKEYWKDVSTGKYALEEVVLDEVSKLDSRLTLKSYPYQKTAYFGLFYDINRVVPDEYDDEGNPVTEDALMFSNEEIIIKLFGLKNYIDERQIGGIAQIVDIIGEAVYFNRYSMNTWIDTSRVIETEVTIAPKFSVSKLFGYVEDVRPIINNYATCPLPRTEFIAEDTQSIRLGNYPNCFVGYFDPLSMDDPQYIDEPEIPVGCPITLTNQTFDMTWAQAAITWANTLQSNLTMTWNTLGNSNYYETEWVITKHVTAEDARTWEFRYRAATSSNRTITAILPYDGFYDVTLILYGYGGEMSRKTINMCIQVALKEADFISFYRYFDKKLQRWNTNPLRWKDLNSEWKNTVFDNNNFLIGDNEIHNRSFNTLNYIDTDDLGIPNVGIEPPAWNQYPDNTWKDFGFQTWKSLIHPREKLARFIITAIVAGGEIQVGEDRILLPSNINVHDFAAVADLLSNSNGTDVSSFTYIARSVNPDETPIMIDAVSKSAGSVGDRFVGGFGGVVINADLDFKRWRDLRFRWNEVNISWNNAANIFRTQSVDNPFSYDNVQIYKDRYTVPIMVPVFLVVDNSKMPGKTKVTWKIRNENTGEEILNIELFTMTYRFSAPGYYTVEAIITDTNGNVNSKSKYKHVRVLDCENYNNFQKYRYSNENRYVN